MSESTRLQGIIQTGRAQKRHIPLQCSMFSISFQLLIPGRQKVPSFLTSAPTQTPFEAIRASLQL